MCGQVLSPRKVRDNFPSHSDTYPSERHVLGLSAFHLFGERIYLLKLDTRQRQHISPARTRRLSYGAERRNSCRASLGRPEKIGNPFDVVTWAREGETCNTDEAGERGHFSWSSNFQGQAGLHSVTHDPISIFQFQLFFIYTIFSSFCLSGLSVCRRVTIGYRRQQITINNTAPTEPNKRTNNITTTIKSHRPVTRKTAKASAVIDVVVPQSTQPHQPESTT